MTAASAASRRFRRTSALARGGRARRAECGGEVPRRGRRDLRRRLLVHRNAVGVAMPKGKRSFTRPSIPSISTRTGAEIGLVGDAGLGWMRCSTRSAGRVKSARDATAVATEIGDLARGLARQMDAEADPRGRAAQPLPGAVGPAKHRRPRQRHHHPRCRQPARPLSPFWGGQAAPYLGWGKTTQLGYGLGLAMGAKLAGPEKLCINVWGDAAIGFTGMDFETAVRERIPIMSVLLNNFRMAIELKVMPISTEKFRCTDISGDYAAMARAIGGMESGSPSRKSSSRRSSAASKKRRRACRCCWSSSPRKESEVLAAGDLSGWPSRFQRIGRSGFRLRLEKCGIVERLDHGEDHVRRRGPRAPPEAPTSCADWRAVGPSATDRARSVSARCRRRCPRCPSGSVRRWVCSWPALDSMSDLLARC